MIDVLIQTVLDRLLLGSREKDLNRFLTMKPIGSLKIGFLVLLGFLGIRG